MRTRTHRPLRRSLRLSVWEGVFAEIFNACAGPTILVGWALELRCTPVEVGLVSSLPQLAQLIQIPAAWATLLFGRRRLAIATIAISRQALLPLSLLPILSPSPGAARAILVAVAASSAALGTAGNVAWTAWMGDLVPRRMRGRYFGRRAGICVLGGTMASLATARVLDEARGPGVALVLSLLALTSSLVGAVTAVLLARQHEPSRSTGPRPQLAAALRPLRDRSVRAILSYQVAWNGSVGLAGGYFSFHLLRNLHAGFVIVALHAAGGALARSVSAPSLGRMVDRIGARRVLAACSFGSAGLPLLWLAASPGTLWPLALDAALGGVAWGGHGLASFAVPLEVAPRRERPFYIAIFSSAGGLAYALATAAGGALLGALTPQGPLATGSHSAIRILFVLSAGGRLASAFLALRMARPEASALGELRRVARAALAPLRPAA